MNPNAVRAAGAFCIGLLCVTGCSEILGVSDYHVAKPTSPDARPPPDPGFLAGAECEGCVDDKCATVAAACDADRACTELRACRARCQDPICHEQCAEKQGLVFMWIPLLEDLYACVRAECDTECKPGRHWACTCDYSPPSGYYAQDIDIRLSISIFLGPFPPSVEVRACAKGALDCNAYLVRTETTTPLVTLTVPSGAQGFEGRFEASAASADSGAGTLDLMQTTTVESLPYTPRVQHLGLIQPRSLLEAYVKQGGWELDRSRSYVQLFPYDCQWAPGANLQVEVSETDDQVHTVYWKASLPNLQADRTGAGIGDGVTVLGVPAPVVHQFTMRDVDSGKTVASIGMATGQDNFWMVSKLFPRTRADCSP